VEGEFGYTTSGTDDGWASSNGRSGDGDHDPAIYGDYDPAAEVLGDYALAEHPGGGGDADNLMLI
jgi:hypothetical protein